MLRIDAHPLLHLGAFEATFPAPLGEMETPSWLRAYLTDNPEAPVSRSEEIRARTRDLLRKGGYKPTGRGKPASEYLFRAASEGALGSINLAVDACNAVSLQSGLPISVVDLDRVNPPLRVGLGEKGESYVFNASGQEIQVTGLLCLHDQSGPCANAVKDSQRTKTGAETTRVLCLVWGSRDLADHVDRTVVWYRDTLERAGVVCRDIETV